MTHRGLGQFAIVVQPDSKFLARTGNMDIQLVPGHLIGSMDINRAFLRHNGSTENQTNDSEKHFFHHGNPLLFASFPVKGLDAVNFPAQLSAMRTGIPDLKAYFSFDSVEQLCKVAR
jgi:hypothetical protein